LALNRVKSFEDGLLAKLRGSHADILEDIRATRDLSDATGAKLKDVVESFAKSFA
jgi:F-type H+-transporting ATPase subunit alpha